MKRSPRRGLDDRIKTYLIYLAHVKNSISLSIHEKVDILKVAEDIAHEEFTAVEKIKTAKVNSFNAREVDRAMAEIAARVERLIDGQMKRIKRLVAIDASAKHSVREAVESLELAGPNLATLRKDHVDRLFSVWRFYNPPEKPIDVKKATAKATKDFDDQMSKISYTAFNGILEAGSGTAAKPEAYFRAVVALNAGLKETGARLVPRESFAAGFAYLESAPGRFVAALKDPEADAEMAVLIEMAADRFDIEIEGWIDDGGTREAFSIKKAYSRSIYDSVINAFRLRDLLDGQAGLGC